MTSASRMALLLGAFLALACGEEEPESCPGRELYLTYCASCHGVDGRGDGPVASALKVRPTNLTRLQEGDEFDEGDVMAAIDGRREVDGHGTREMPVWGAVFVSELDTFRYTEYTTLLRARDLMEYLRSIQMTDGSRSRKPARRSRRSAHRSLLERPPI